MHWVKVTRPKGHVLVLPFDNTQDALEFVKYMWENPHLGDTDGLINVRPMDAINFIEGLTNEQ